MKIRFNWGTGIFIVIVFIFLGDLDINLVEKNYYEKELVYEQRIAHIRNTEGLAEKISVVTLPDRVVLQFPDTVRDAGISGTIWFYRPSDESRDFTVPITLNDSLNQVFGKEKLFPGKYVIKMDWQMAGVPYYQEEVLILQ